MFRQALSRWFCEIAKTFSARRRRRLQSSGRAIRLAVEQTIQFDAAVFAALQTIPLSLGELDLNAIGTLAIEEPATGVTISSKDFTIAQAA